MVRPFCLLMLLTQALFVPLGGAELTLEVSGVKPEKGGDLLVLLWKNGEGFPYGQKAFLRRVLAPAESLSVVVSNLPAGVYGAAVIHDANRNGKLDWKFIGFPAEGSMFTGGKRPFGPPSWANHRFELGPAGGRQSISLIY